MNIHYFNPDTDLALACNGEHYIAPEQVRGMARDLALLPLWYAGAGEKVWITDRKAMDYASQMCLMFGMKVEGGSDLVLQANEDVEMMPWGWNPSVRQFFLKHGVPADSLPSADWLEAYRRLASRQTSAGLLQGLTDGGLYKGEAEVLHTLDECRAYAASRGAVVFKAPWSSSGKGLCWCRNGFALSAGWCGKVLREQGMLVASPIYNKVEDFALEFESDEAGKICFMGYSLFMTDGCGRYLGNRVLSAEAFEEYMLRYVSKEVWPDLQFRTSRVLSYYAEAGYQGPLGVDMMVCLAEDGEYFIYPMVEVNLRMNMGLVALRLSERVLGEKMSGIFSIRHHASNEALRAELAQLQQDSPPQVVEGRLVGGCLPLVPITSVSRCVALLSVVSG